MRHIKYDYKQTYEVIGKSVVLDVDDSEVMRKVQDSLNDTIREAYRLNPSAQIVSVKLDSSSYDCYVSIEVKA